jgi:hypothetical protein
MTPIERRSIDYGELEGAMVHLELAIRDTRRTLDMLARREADPAKLVSPPEVNRPNTRASKKQP